MQLPYVVEDPQVEGVVRISRDEDLPHPHVGIVGAVHGNEPCGLGAIADLRVRANSGDLVLGEGTIVLIHGNPEASRQDVRYTKDGEDLNRIFDLAYVGKIPREQWGYEHRRAVELSPIIEGLDALLDLHSASSVTPAFAIINEAGKSRDIARHLGVRHVTHAWNEVTDKVLGGALASLDRPALCIECGQHDDPRAAELAKSAAEKFLLTLGVLQGTFPPKAQVIFLEVTEILKKPSPSFQFARPIQGLTVLEAGDVLGTDGTIDFTLERQCYALLPNEDAHVGDDLVYLAQEVPSD